MANVVTHPQPHIAFPSGPASHAPSPFGFGFGLSSTPAVSSWPSTPAYPPPSQWNISSTMNQPPPLRVTKRRLETDDDTESSRHGRDDAMDRSPTPERPRRAAPKRARTTPVVLTVTKDEKNSAETKAASNEESDVDVGVLLASLPQQALLPLLTSLLSKQPSLKSTLLSLIPRPTLDTATQAIVNAAKKLMDAYPYSNAQISMSGNPASLGFNPGEFGSGRPNPAGNSTGFGFGFTNRSHTPQQSGGMRNEYILSRLSPHITDFVSACSTYLPYFSCISVSPASHSASTTSRADTHVQPHTQALQSQHKHKCHPSETFMFLHAIMTQMLSQPALTQSSLVPLLLPRLREEWKAWVNRVDEIVNREGGMFGHETVRGWERTLDEFAQAKGNGLEVMREVRDTWVLKVGWLVGRQPMEEEL